MTEKADRCHYRFFKVGLQRSARTDRGVHAAGNLLTLKLILEPPGIGPGELVTKMNETLPEVIRIWGFTKVENSFNARTSCDSRQYEYLLPTYVFLPPKPGSHMHNMMQKWKSDMKEEEDVEADKGDEYRPTLDYVLNHPFWRAQGSDKTFAEDTIAKKAWRISSTQLDRVRDIFTKYQGSHNFHNFTLGKAFRDRSSHRNMLKLTISEPKLINDTEWVSIKFHGQSFMLHQIRKMIGLLILVGRSTAPASLVPETYGPARIHVPKAPGLGLLLEEPLFEGYNKRLRENMNKQNEGSTPAKGDGGVIKEEITYNKYAEEKEAFKNKWIYDRIYKEEEETSE
jgi:tRNA pseudouridine38-40 synthase